MSILKKNRVSELLQAKKGKSNYARCIVVRDGVREEIHLGRWGTEEAEVAYRRICAEVYGDMPMEIPEADSITLSELFDKYLEYAEKRKDFRDLNNAETIIGIVIQ